MNCIKAERWILLSGSGELTPKQSAKLERHVGACAHCAGYREEVRRIIGTAQLELPAGEPAPRVLAAVRRAAADHVSDENPRLPRFTVLVRWRPMTAMAASLLLCAALWYMLAGGVRLPREILMSNEGALVHEGDLIAPDDILSLGLDDTPYIERIADLDGAPDVSVFERELMILDGLAI